MPPKQCNPCRKQNIECTGDDPRCKQCTSSGKQDECSYPATPVIKRRTKLARRQACEPCKRKKRKCDGVHPRCGTCEASGGTCTWDHIHLRPSGKLRKIKPLEPGPSESGETRQSQRFPPVASTSYLPPPEQPRNHPLGYDTVVPNIHEMNYPDQLFQPSMMPFSGQYAQTGFVDPSFYAAPDVPPPDLDLDFRRTFYAHNAQCGTALLQEKHVWGPFA